MRKQKLLCWFSHLFLNWFKWNLVCYHNLLVCWRPYHYLLVCWRPYHFLSFLFDSCEYHVELCYDSCSASWPAILCCKKNFFFIYCHADRHHWLLPLYSVFTDLDLVWGSIGQCKAKPNCLIFSHTFCLIRMKFDVVMKQFKLNTLRLLLSTV